MTADRADVAVVGAGAAGLLAAAFAARAGTRVVLYERTADGGRKILISGGGRCNILPSDVRPEWFVTDSSPHSLRKILRTWPLDAQREFFERELGLALRLEPESGKLFPVTNRARDVRDALVGHAQRRGAEVRFGARLLGLDRTADGFRLGLDGAPPCEARCVILATGGLSVPTTGSDGLGLQLAGALGHVVHPTYPALTPLTTSDARWTALSGVSLDARLSAPPESPAYARRQGFLFTHRGFSGPAVLNISHVRTRPRAGPPPAVRVEWGQLDRRDWSDLLADRGRGRVATLLRSHLPERLADALLEVAGVPADRVLAQLRREERTALLDALCAFELPIAGDEGYRKAEVTGGGVALSEVEPTTLESRRVAGLFLCGEILDAFGPIGGYNFLWAWATGRAAGLGAQARVRL